MNKKDLNSNQSLQKGVNKEAKEPEGYPLYPETEDIYSKFKKEKRIETEHESKLKVKEFVGSGNDKDYIDDITWSELDIPEIESVDVGDVPDIDDEENDYFSLGVDDHIDPEENQDL